MRKLVVFLHTSLDGFVAGPNGEMDWINVDEQMFDYAGRQTASSDTALYGRKTFEMMDSYWPDAGKQPNASKHDIEHSEWYNNVPKIVLSRTMQDHDRELIHIISDNIKEKITELKNKDGKDIVVFGSPSAVHTLMNIDLIDDFWLFINPILLGEGIPLFKDVKHRISLKLVEQHVFDSGVIGVHYIKV